MDETNDQGIPVEEPAKATSCGRGHFFGGVLSGTIVGGALALLLAPLRSEQQAQTSGGPSRRSREGIEQEARLRAKVAVERVQSIAGGVLPAIIGAWAAVRERLSDAVEEGKEGIAEGQAEARARYEIKTKRRRRR